MDLNHKFTVPASVEDTWAAFQDMEMVAGCFPGAALTSVEGDDFKGTCKVKLGPIALVYTGSGTFIERDESARRFKIDAKGKDKRGNGTAGAKVTAVLTSAGSESTDVEVTTDLAITGKPAQFGRGVMQDVSDKLLQQFVDCLKSKVGQPEEEQPPAPAPTTRGNGAASHGASAPATGSTGPSTGPGVSTPRTDPPPAAKRDSDEAIDLGATVLPILLRAYGKQIGAALGVLVALLVLRKLFRGR